MKKKQRKFLVGFGLVICAIGYLIYTGATEATMYYKTVSELQADPVYEKNMRLHGEVVIGSIKRGEVGTMRVQFMAQEGGLETPVVYTGVIPDQFKDESEIVVEGKYSPDGTFTAHTMYAKCPSKYESEGVDEYDKYEQAKPIQTEPQTRS
jgi:cytochrome c-type biogenesis protein CcmE